MQKQPFANFFKIGVLKNFAIFTGNIQQLFYRIRPVAASVDVPLYIIFSKRRYWIYCSYILHNYFILNPKITLIYFHSLSFVVPLVLIRCITCWHSLSLYVTRCRLLSVLSFVVTRFHSLPFVLPIVVIRCHSMYHSPVFLCTIKITCFISRKETLKSSRSQV